MRRCGRPGAPDGIVGRAPSKTHRPGECKGTMREIIPGEGAWLAPNGFSVEKCKPWDTTWVACFRGPCRRGAQFMSRRAAKAWHPASLLNRYTNPSKTVWC